MQIALYSGEWLVHTIYGILTWKGGIMCNGDQGNAIRKYCFEDCNCGSASAVEKCECDQCPLYPFRLDPSKEQ